MAALSTIAAITAIAAAGSSIVHTLTAKPVKTPGLPALPAAPQIDATAQQAVATRRNARISATDPRSATLLTSPQGLGTAPTARSTLLGM